MSKATEWTPNRVTQMCLINHEETRASSSLELFLGFCVSSGQTCVTCQGLGRAEKPGCPRLTYLTVLSSVTASQFYRSNFLEPSTKPSEVEPEASTIIVS